MTAVSVTFDGTRVNDAESTTNWVAAGTTPTLEPDFRYQNANCISALVKTAEVGFYYRNAATSYNFSSPRRVILFKGIQTNKDALDGNGYIIEIGTGARTAYYQYYVFTSTTYPIAGGWQLIPIDPNEAGYANNTVGGGPTLTTVDMFGTRSDCNATAKAPNLGMDAIDFFANGEGLTLSGGDGADTDGTFSNFVTTDEGTTSNRWGIVSTRDGVLYVLGTLSIGSGSTSPTEFTDSNRVLVFPDGRFGTGFQGLVFNLSHLNTTCSLDSCVFTGRGVSGTLAGTGVDTRPRYTVTGSNGKLGITGSLFNTFEKFTANSKTTLLTDTFLSGSKLFQSGAIIQDCTVQRAVRIASQSFIVSDNPALIQGCTFEAIATGNGHAIEIINSGTYSFTNNNFTNYQGTAGSNLVSSSGSGHAAVFNNSGGSVTLNVVGGNSPSVRNGASATTTVNNSVVITITVKNVAGTALQNVRVAIYTDDANETELLNDLTNASGEVTTNYAYTSTQPVFIRARAASGSPAYQDIESSATITGDGLVTQITMQEDLNV